MENCKAKVSLNWDLPRCHRMCHCGIPQTWGRHAKALQWDVEKARQRDATGAVTEAGGVWAHTASGNTVLEGISA